MASSDAQDDDKREKEQTYSLSSKQFLGNLYSLYTSQSLCDAKVIAENREFKVHRVVMAAASNYFERVFSSSWLETETGEVQLNGIGASSIDILLSSVYTQELKLTAETVLGVLEAAHRLEFNEIFTCCESYIEEIIGPSNCLEYLWAAETYNMPAVLLAAEKCLMENFSAVSKQTKFLEMDRTAVQQFLKRDGLKCDSELDVFNSIIRWLDHVEDRKEHAESLLKNVRFGLIPLTDLLKIVWKEPVMLEPNCQEMLRKAIEYNSNKFEKPFAIEQWAQPRCTNEHLVIIGGSFDTLTTPPPLAVPFDKPRSKYFPLLSQLKPLTDNYKTGATGVQIGHYLYIFGGYYFYPSSSTTMSSRDMVCNSVWRFDSVALACEQLTGMLVARKDHTAFLYNKFIIVAGGKNDEKKNMNSTEVYNIAENKWEVGEYLPESLINLAGCSHGGRAYISGGQTIKNTRDYSSRKLYKYDTILKEWIERASMLSERCEHVMASTPSGLIVMGGIRITGNNRHRNRVTIQHCSYPEIYDPAADQWTTIRIQMTIAKPACIVKKEKSTDCGGVEYVNSASSGYRLSAILCLNSETKTLIEVEARLPFHIENAVMCLMPMQLELWPSGDDHSEHGYSPEWGRESPDSYGSPAAQSYGSPGPVSDNENWSSDPGTPRPEDFDDDLF